MPENYINPLYTNYRNTSGASLQEEQKENNRWKTSEDTKRIKQYEMLWNLYLGKHWTGDGGPFSHPHGVKGVKENITYQQINLLAKASNIFADLITGDNIVVTSKDKNTEAKLDLIKFDNLIWEALIRTSVFGFIGLQPIQKQEHNQEFWTISLISPYYLFLEYAPNTDDLLSIRKCIVFNNIKISKDKEINVLYEEVHLKGYVETKIYQIEGDYRIRELPLSFYTEYIDKDAELYEVWETGLDDFLITILYNNVVDNTAFSDYTPTAVRQQQSLNEVLTQIHRVLKIHSSPKLMAPRNKATRDSVSGEYRWIHADSEVLWFEPQDPNPPFSYLTWDGNLNEAVEERNQIILSLLTELTIAPELLSYTNLVPASSAETAAKLKRLMNATLKLASRKKFWLDSALTQVITNILKLYQLENSFSIAYPEFLPQERQEVLEEIVLRKNNNLITTVEAVQKLDNISEEEALKKANNIFNETNKQATNNLDNFFSLENQPTSQL